MRERTIREALAYRRETLQLMLTVVSRDIVRATPLAGRERRFVIGLAGDRTTLLSMDGERIGLRVAEYVTSEPQYLEARNSPPLALVGYMYSLHRSRDDAELLAFHHHPHVLDRSLPHVHPGPALGTLPVFAGVHIPTGHVALEDVLSMVIDDFGVRPRRADWRVVLATTRRTVIGS